MKKIKNKATKLDRLVWLGAVLLLILTGIWWFNPPLARETQHLNPAGSSSPSNPEEELDNFIVNHTLFKNKGHLAFIQNGLLYALDGQTGSLVKLSKSGSALQPKWSHDGQWLAYILLRNKADTSGSLWMVRRDGSQAHQIQGLPENIWPDSYSWSPTANQLLVSNQGIWLVSTQESPKQLVNAETDLSPSLIWSPDGKQIAYSQTLPYKEEAVMNRSDALYTMNILDGQAVKQLVSQAAGIRPIMWWPDGKGLLYWEDPFHSASIAADGLDLCSYRIGEQKAHHFSPGLTDHNYLSSSDGMLLRVSGSGRELWTQKWLELCDLKEGTAKRLNLPAGSVAADPSLSPDTERIAFVSAPDLGSENYPDAQQLEGWANRRTLWIANKNGSEAKPLSKAGGDIHEPQWSGDGKDLLYISEDCLWLIDKQGKERHKILGPFSTAAGQFDYGSGNYVFAWYKG